MTFKTAASRLTRVALLVPSSNTVMENDLHASLPKDRFTVHTDRMYLVDCTREAEIRMIEEHAPAAANDLATLRPDVLVFGCTSAGSLFGLDYDRKVCKSLGERSGCPTIGVISAVETALGEKGWKRVAVIAPYNEDLTQAVASAVTSENRQVVAAFGMGITDNIELATPTPDQIVAFAVNRLKGSACDGVFVSCTNFRALEARNKLQDALGVDVVTSNSATIQAIEAFAS